MGERKWENVAADQGPRIKFVKPSQLAKENFEGVIVEGEFVEAMVNPFDSSKNDFKFEAFNGDTIVVNHAGHLAHLMRDINPGDICQIIYQGKLEYKGRESHTFKVNVDRSGE